jgi:tryptophan 2,3-dioxygenase
MLTVQGIYEKGTVQIKGFAPDFERCEVFVTFLPVAYEMKQNDPYLLSDPQLKSIQEKNKAIDDVLVSWNFKHIVNVHRIRGYNSVNLKNGYKQLEIRSPKEVIFYELG